MAGPRLVGYERGIEVNSAENERGPELAASAGVDWQAGRGDTAGKGVLTVRVAAALVRAAARFPAA